MAPKSPATGKQSTPQRPRLRVNPAPGQTITIGRDPGSTIVLNDPLVSRQHAMVTRQGSNFLVRNHRSRNGTQINGHDIEEAELTEGDRLTIGRTSLVNHHGVLVELEEQDTALVAHGISFQLKEGKAAGKVLLDRASFEIPGAAWWLWSDLRGQASPPCFGP